MRFQKNNFPENGQSLYPCGPTLEIFAYAVDDLNSYNLHKFRAGCQIGRLDGRHSECAIPFYLSNLQTNFEKSCLGEKRSRKGMHVEIMF